MSILVTRPSPAGEELVSRLRTLGQVAWHFPLIEFSPGRQLPQLADQLAALGESDLLFALSQHAVAFAQSQLHQQDRKWPRLPTYFAIGRTTALALHTVSGQKILYPQDREISEVLLQLPELQNIAGKRALILRGNGGREGRPAAHYRAHDEHQFGYCRAVLCGGYWQRDPEAEMDQQQPRAGCF